MYIWSMPSLCLVKKTQTTNTMGNVLAAMEIQGATQPCQVSERYVCFLVRVSIQLIFTVYQTER